jgi:hypothetical protein
MACSGTALPLMWYRDVDILRVAQKSNKRPATVNAVNKLRCGKTTRFCNYLGDFWLKKGSVPWSWLLKGRTLEESSTERSEVLNICYINTYKYWNKYVKVCLPVQVMCVSNKYWRHDLSVHLYEVAVIGYICNAISVQTSLLCGVRGHCSSYSRWECGRN